MITKELIPKIEMALGFELLEWQVKYLLKEPQVLDLRWTGRRTGKTTLSMLDLLLGSDKPLFLLVGSKEKYIEGLKEYENIIPLGNVVDWYAIMPPYERGSSKHDIYAMMYLKDLQDLRERLVKCGVPVREIKVFKH